MEIIDKYDISTTGFVIQLKSMDIAKNALPGQFVVIMVDENSERVPLTICKADPSTGILEFAIDKIGRSSHKLGDLAIGDEIYSLLGPLGQPSSFVYWDEKKLQETRVLLVGGGLGVAPLLPQARWLHDHGVDFDVVLGFRSGDLVIYEDDFRDLAGDLLICTDDGSYGYSGLVGQGLDDLVRRKEHTYDICYMAGSLIMMKYTSQVSLGLGLETIVSMNPIMVDATGMCGACRVSVGGQIKFACVDGPEFDASLIDFDEAISRNLQYVPEEEEAFHDYCQMKGAIINGQEN